MRYAFLEKLAQDGDIAIEDKSAIYATCGHILDKIAFKMPFRKEVPTWGEAFGELGSQILTRFALPAGGVGALAYGFKKYDEKVHGPGLANEEVRKILKIKADILKDPEFATHQEKAEARFDEVARLSPQTALRPELALRIIKSTLHSGLTADQAQRLAQLQATQEKGLFPSAAKVEDVQKSLSKRAEVLPPADAGRLAATIIAILGESCVGHEKVALRFGRSPLQRATNIAKQVLTTGAIVSGFGALVGLGAGAVNAAMKVYDKKKDAERMRSSFEEAMRRSDPGREPLHQNKEKAMQAFQTLTHFAPHVAADPEAARAFMLNLVSMDQGAQVTAIKDLSEIEKNLKLVKGPKPFLAGLQSGLEMTGVPGALGSVSKGVFEPVVEHGASEIRWEMGY